MVTSLPAGATTVLWDFDGTIADSATATLSAIRFALDACGHERIAVSADRFVGPPLASSLQSFGLSATQIDDVSNAYRVAFLERHIGGVKPFSGVIPILRSAQACKFRQAIISNRLDTILRRISALLEVDVLVDALFGRDGVRATKRDVAHAALQALGTSPNRRVILIGDRADDVDLAREMGISSIGVEWGYGTRTEVARSDLVVGSPAALMVALHLA